MKTATGNDRTSVSISGVGRRNRNPLAIPRALLQLLTETGSSMEYRPIGIFDSGFGGLTVLKEIERTLPQYDYLYFGDNARAPYGSRSFETVYAYTLEAVQWLFDQGCRSGHSCLQHRVRKSAAHDSAEGPAPHRARAAGPGRHPAGDRNGRKNDAVPAHRHTGNGRDRCIAILRDRNQQIFSRRHGRAGSMSHVGAASGEQRIRGRRRRLFRPAAYRPAAWRRTGCIDTVVLGCTHYPLLEKKISRYLSAGISVISQGAIVAQSLADYLLRHPEIAERCSTQGRRDFYSSETADVFERSAILFYGRPVRCRQKS